jgi:hypothetical protein
MRKMFILVFVSVAISCLAQEKDIPTRRILPEDVVQESITVLPLSTNNFAINWTYTEAGAKKVLAFNEEHQGQKTRLLIGSFETPQFLWVSPGNTNYLRSTNYVQWKESWLKHRTDKMLEVNEEDTKKIVAGMKSK